MFISIRTLDARDEEDATQGTLLHTIVAAGDMMIPDVGFQRLAFFQEEKRPRRDKSVEPSLDKDGLPRVKFGPGNDATILLITRKSSF